MEVVRITGVVHCGTSRGGRRQDAEALSNCNTAGYTPENRVEIDLEKTPWIILDRMMHHGLKFEEERKKRVRRRTGRKESFLADGP